jgi:Tol biopolymer transport system component
VWIYDVTRGIPSRFTFDPGLDNNPAWTPDGKVLYFCSLRKGKGRFNIFRKSIAGSGADELFFDSDQDKFPNQVTPDGTSLVFHTRGDPRTRTDLWLLPLSGKGEPTSILRTEFGEQNAAVSPDGRYIAYESDESGRIEIYVSPFPVASRKWQVSPSGGERPAWRRDGREIVYLAPDNRLTATEVALSPTDFQAGATTPLFPIQPQRPGNLFNMTPDGRRFIVNMSVVEQNSLPLTLLLPWTAAAGRR